MLKAISMKDLDINKTSDGNYGTPYQPPSFPSIEEVEKVLKVEEGMKIYQGNFHCKAVTYSVVTKPLEKQEVMNCNCSLCSRVRFALLVPSSMYWKRLTIKRTEISSSTPAKTKF